MDLMLVITSLVEIGISMQRSHTSLKFVRLLRLLRVVRTLRSVRILRVLRMFGKFRMLLHAIQNSISPLLWACILLFCMLYVASLVFLNGVAEYFVLDVTETDVAETLQKYFGCLYCCMLSLFMCISGGFSWETAVYALMKIHVAYGILLVLFIASMLLAALNIFAGIFVNDAIELCQQDRDSVIQAESKKNQATEKDVKELFQEFDTDGSGTLTRMEFMEAFKKESVQAQFRHLGVDFTDTQSLFEMLDIGDDDELGIDEFASMCLRAKMLTRPVDQRSFMQHNRRTNDQFRREFANVKRKIAMLQTKMISAIESRTNSGAVVRTQERREHVKWAPLVEPPRLDRRVSHSTERMGLQVRGEPSSRAWLM